MKSTSTQAGLGNPVAPGRLTLAVSRANGRSEARAEAVGVGSSALFGHGPAFSPWEPPPLHTRPVA